MSDFEQLYRNAVVELYNPLPIFGLTEVTPYPLDQVFVYQQQFLDIIQTLQNHTHVSIIGPPGTGKTTLLHWFAIYLARNQHEALGISLNYLPIFVELRQLMPFLQEHDGQSLFVLEKDIASFVCRSINVPSEWLQQTIVTQPCLILLDEFDEVKELQGKLFEAIETLAHHYPHLLFVLTSRLPNRVKFKMKVKPFELFPFEPHKVIFFIKTWYAQVYGEGADKLITEIQLHPSVATLACTPWLCTLLVAVYQEKSQLPHRPVDLYEKTCELSLAQWEKKEEIHHSGTVGKLSTNAKLGLLERIAYDFHEKQTLLLPEQNVVELLTQGLRELKQKSQEFSKKLEQEAKEFVAAIRHHSGLLQGCGGGYLEFPHRLLQEYLAARYIATQSELRCVDTVMAHLHEAWWQEVHLLVIGHLGSDKRGASQVARLMHHIWSVYPPPSLSLLPKLRVKDLGQYLPSWQWQRRVAWHLQREFVLVAQGFSVCDAEGRTIEWTRRLTEFVNQRVEEWSSAIEEYERPLEVLITTARQTLPKTALIPATEALLVVLEHQEAKVRGLAAKSLGQLGVEKDEVINVLLRTLQDEDSKVRSCAAISLGQLGISSEQVISALLWALQDEDQQVSNGAKESLNQLYPTPILSSLICALKTEYVVSLGHKEEGISACLEGLKSAQAEVRSRAAEGLGQLGQMREDILEALLGALQDENPWVRSYAVSSLGQLDIRHSEEGVRALLRALQDQEGQVRNLAAISLGQLRVNKEEVISDLLKILRNEQGELRRRAVKSLGELGENKPDIVSALLQALRDEEGRVRYQSAQSLGQLGVNDEEIVLALLQTVEDREERVRIQAAHSLEGLPLTEAQLGMVLIRLNHHLHKPRLRYLALETIGKLIAGKPFPEYHWSSLQAQAERKEERERWLKILGGGLVILSMAFILVVVFSGMRSQMPLAQKFSILAPVITIIVGIWQLSIWINAHLIKKVKKRRGGKIRRNY